ncbi:MAG TPA: hypothetical protein VLJ42_05855 [Solirubrobacteraceae bacterium]|nr:hypothetical protein [Solirubrobacteraceae bacterium]
MLHIRDDFAPSQGEAAVLSMVVARQGSNWTVASGSLLTVPTDVAGMSWRRWAERQPHADRQEGLDLGPNFCVEPFDGVRAVRAIVARHEWPALLSGLAEGKIDMTTCPCVVDIAAWTPTVLFGQKGRGDAYDVVEGAKRPVRATVATLNAPELPPTEANWELATPTYLRPGRDLGQMWPYRHLLHWPKGLVGIDWLGSSDFVPPPRLVVGRVESRAWIAGVKPDYDKDELTISIAWDEKIIDPLGCSIVLRTEYDGLPLLVRQHRISDLPSLDNAPREPREVSWRERTLNVRLARGPRRTDWGLKLLSNSGELLDERPVATRVEQIRMTMHIDGSSTPSSVIEIGDKKPPPSEMERDEAVQATIVVESEARQAAARRRISTAGELEQYLRWRFCCRQGDLLLLDSYLLDDKPKETLAFLAGLNRSIRALTRSVKPEITPLLSSIPQLDVRALPNGKSTLHDRIWIVGETGILVGASVGSFLADVEGVPRRATTATDLPFADAAIWRDRFEEWWPSKAAPTNGS